MSKAEKNGNAGSSPTNNADIIVHDLLVEYLPTKPDDYNDNISYLKIIDSKIKLKPLLSLHRDLKMPMWRTDDKGEYIPKSKQYFITTLNDLILKETYVIDINHAYYDMISKKM